MSSSERKAEEAAFARNLHRLNTEGRDAATSAVIRLLNNEKAPLQAVSAAVNTVFRATGMLDVDKEGAGEFDGLSLAELERLILAKEKEVEENKLRATASDDRAQSEGDEEAEDREKSVDGIFD